MVQFTSVGTKDSLRNVRETGEFVVCLATEPLFEQVNATATDFPAGVSEFAEVGLTPEPSALVAPPRVAESPVALECGLHQALELGDSTVVIGRVVHAAVAGHVRRRLATAGCPPSTSCARSPGSAATSGRRSARSWRSPASRSTGRALLPADRLTQRRP